MSHRIWRSAALATSVLLAGCGGCPWITLSNLQVTPAMSCLALQLADSSGTAPSTGCVDPVVFGHNSCADALVVPAHDNVTGMALTFQPGEDILIEVPNERAVRDHGDDFTVAAMLGSSSVTITFHASGGIDR